MKLDFKYVLINKKTKKFVKLDNISMKFIDVDDIFLAQRFDSLTYVSIILKEFRVKSKFEVHEIVITHKKVNL